jgi:hypothetical protein
MKTTHIFEGHFLYILDLKMADEMEDGGDYYRDDSGGGMMGDDDHAMDDIREGEEVGFLLDRC